MSCAYQVIIVDGVSSEICFLSLLDVCDRLLKMKQKDMFAGYSGKTYYWVNLSLFNQLKIQMIYIQENKSNTTSIKAETEAKKIKNKHQDSKIFFDHLRSLKFPASNENLIGDSQSRLSLIFLVFSSNKSTIK